MKLDEFYVNFDSVVAIRKVRSDNDDNILVEFFLNNNHSFRLAMSHDQYIQLVNALLDNYPNCVWRYT